MNPQPSIDLTTIILAFIAGFPAAIAAIVAAYVAIKGNKKLDDAAVLRQVAAEKAEATATASAAKVEEIHKATNSMKDELVAASISAAKVAGAEDQKMKALAEEALILRGQLQAANIPAVATPASQVAPATPTSDSDAIDKVKDVVDDTSLDVKEIKAEVNKVKGEPK